MANPEHRPRLTAAVADVRRAVRAALARSLAGEQGRALVLVGLSGGADSLALAAATAFEAPRAGITAGAVIVDHGLQAGSDAVAATAAAQARALGLDPVLVRRVTVEGEGGPEAAARRARFAAFTEALATTGAARVLLAHTLDDQAETVLLGLARGSGPDSLHGMRADEPPLLRPLLGIRRATTVQACADAGLTPWLDPHNLDPAYARVRVRETVLPTLERELGPGVAVALARTADQLGEDAAALDAMAEELAPDLARFVPGGLEVDAAAVAANPTALVHRLIRLVVEAEFGVTLTRAQTVATAALVLAWHGQGAVHLPGIRVERRQGRLRFTAAAERTASDG